MPSNHPLSESLLRQLVESSDQGVGMIDRDRRIVYVNAKTCRMVGYTEAELLGRDVFELLHETSRELALESLAKREHGVREQLQISGSRKDGSTLWIQLSASPRFDDDGNYQGSIAFLTDITAQKELEQSLQASLAEQQALLRESEARREMLQTILDHLTDSVVAYNTEGRLILANPAGLNHLSVSPEKIHEYGPKEIIERLQIRSLDGSPLTPEDLPARRVLHDGADIAHLDVISQKPGTERDSFTRNTSVAIRDRAGKLSGVITVIQDTTEKTLAERERTRLLAEQQALLRETEARREMLQTILDHLTDSVIAFNLEGRLILANPVAQHHLGIPPENLHEYSPQELINHLKIRRLDGSPVKPEELTSLRVLRGENIAHTDTITQKPGTGRDSFSRTTSAAIRDREGKLTGVISVTQDTTVKTLAEFEKNRLLQELTSQKELLQGILDNIEDAVYVIQLDGTVGFANQKALEMMGFTRAPETPIHVKDAPSLLSIRDFEGNPIPLSALTVTRALEGEKPRPVISIMRNSGANKDVFIQSTSTPLSPSTGKRVVSILRDVSQFIELDRMKDQFIRVAAHELKTPVTLVKINAEILPKTLENPSERQKTILRHLVQGSERIDRITRDLLDLSQIHLDSIWFNQQNFDLGELFRETIARWQKPEAKHAIHAHQPKKPIHIKADRDRVEQVIDSLLDNAIKYSPAGGDIHVTLGLKDSHAILTVQDHGIGIPEHKQANVFERFYRAHTDTPLDAGGLGIGLFVTREIVTRLGGQIQFESKEGQGTWFSVSLPRQIEEEQ